MVAPDGGASKGGGGRAISLRSRSSATSVEPAPRTTSIDRVITSTASQNGYPLVSSMSWNVHSQQLGRWIGGERSQTPVRKLECRGGCRPSCNRCPLRHAGQEELIDGQQFPHRHLSGKHSALDPAWSPTRRLIQSNTVTLPIIISDYGKTYTMRTTIDKAGRLVVPKAFRDRLGLSEGVPLEVTTDGVGLRIEPVREGGHLVERDGRLVVTSVTGRAVSDDEVRRAIDAGRR